MNQILTFDLLPTLLKIIKHIFRIINFTISNKTNPKSNLE